MDTLFPAYSGEGNYMFVCYSHDDKSVVYPQLEQLRDLGANVWYDEGITPGESWSKEIADAIDGAEAFICFVSPALVRSRHCANEIEYAVSCDKRILAIHTERTPLPGWLNLTLGASQAIHRYALDDASYRVKLRAFLNNEGQPVSTASSPRASVGERFGFARILSRIPQLNFPRGRRQAREAARGHAPVARKAEIPAKSIAILPFTSVDQNREGEYLGAGLAEDLMGSLARQTDLRVAARTSSFAFSDNRLSVSEIAARLKVRSIVEGTIRTDGDRVHISAQLIDAANGYQLWGQTFDRRIEEMQTIKLEILDHVTRVLGADTGVDDDDGVVTSVPLTQVGEAYQCYLRGKYHWAQRGENDIRESMDLFYKAIELDPNFGRAHSSLAAAYVTLPEYSNAPVITAYQRAQQHAKEALRLDGSIGEAHSVIAAVNSWNWEWVSAEAAFRRALEVEPTDTTSLIWYSELLVELGRLEESENLLKKAFRVDPVSPPVNYALSWLYLSKGQNDEALRFATLSADYGQPYGYMVQSLVHIRERRIQQALEARRKFSEALGIDVELGSQIVEAIFGKLEISDVVARLDAMRQQGEFSSTTVLYNYFALQTDHVMMGQREKLFRLMEDLIDQHFVRMRVLWLPEARPLISDPMLRKVAHKIGFVKAWRENGPPDQYAISETGILSE